MLVFIDESYKTDNQGVLQHVIGGIAIEDVRYRFLEAGLHRIKQRFLHPREGLTQEEIQPFMSTKILVNGDPEQYELKGEALLQNRRLRLHSPDEPSPSVLLVEECLHLLVACRCTTFGILSNPFHVDDIQKADQCPVQYVRLFGRLDRWMREEFPGQVAIPVFDSIHGGANLHLTHQIAKYLHRHALGKSMVRIVPAPFWIDSTTTAGSQIADIVAHILMNSMMPVGERKPIGFLWQKVMSLMGGDGTYRTITKIGRGPTGRD